METEIKMPSSQTHSLSRVETTAKAIFPPGLKISFGAVSGFVPAAHTWHAVIGVPYSGLTVIKGSTRYFIEEGGALHLSELEKLERLAMVAQDAVVCRYLQCVAQHSMHNGSLMMANRHVHISTTKYN